MPVKTNTEYIRYDNLNQAPERNRLNLKQYCYLYQKGRQTRPHATFAFGLCKIQLEGGRPLNHKQSGDVCVSPAVSRQRVRGFGGRGKAWICPGAHSSFRAIERKHCPR